MNYLETEGKLPKVDPKYKDANWEDPAIRQQPGIKERMDLLEYRTGKNQERARLGLPQMSVLEAMTQRMLDGQQAAESDKKNKAGEARKAAGAMVGGAAPSAPSNIPNDLIVGEGGSIRDLNPAY
jgi:hypothetical protein